MPEVVGRLRTPRLPSAPSSPALGEAYYNTTDNTLYWWNGTAWISASGSGADLVYNGAYPANTPYTDGDVVIYNGMAYLCVRPTSAAPTPWTGISGPTGPAGPQGPQGAAGAAGAQGAGVPTVVNGTFLKGTGGAAVWTAIQAADVTDAALVAADTGWRYIGDAGNPAWNAGWSHWDVVRKVGFRKLASGLVVWCGLAKVPSGTDGASCGSPFTIPAGYRPPLGDNYHALQIYNGGWAGTSIAPSTGVWNFLAGSQTTVVNGWWSFNGVVWYPS